MSDAQNTSTGVALPPVAPDDRRDAILEAIAFAATRFLETPAWEDVIDEALSRLGQGAGVSRVYLFENHPGPDAELLTSQRFEWTASGIGAHLGDPANQNTSWDDPGFEGWVRTLSSGEVVRGRAASFSSPIEAFLSAQDVRSILIAPLFVDGEWWGTIGFDDCAHEREWSQIEVDALKAAAGTVSAAVSRKRADERLREAEERHRTLVENAPIVTYLETTGDAYDASTSMMYVSPQMDQLLGYPHESWGTIPGFWWTVVHPDDMPRVLAEAERTTGTGEPFNQEYRMITADGRIVWVLDRSVMLPREPGQPALWQGALMDLRERKEAEQRLREAEERYRALVEHLPTVIYREPLVWNPSTFYLSPQVGTIFGHDPDVWRTTRGFWRARIHPDDRERVLGLNDRANATGEPYSVEYRFRKADGEYAWIHDQATLIRDEHGEPLFWQGFMLDITERAQAEEALREAERKYRALVEQNPAVIYTQTIDEGETGLAQTVYISPGAAELTGYTAEESVENPALWREIIHPDDRERVLATDLEGNVSGEPFDMQYRVLAKDGRVVWVHDRAVLISDEQGRPLFWQGFMLDITERKQAEEALRTAEEKYRELFENANDLIYTHDLRGTITSINKAAEHLLGYPREEVLGTAISRFVAPEHRVLAREMIARSIAGIPSSAYQLDVVARDGTRIPIEVSARLILEDGEPVGVQGVARDVTERRRAEEELERALEVEREAGTRLRALDDMKNTFLQAVSHDLRTPLAAILGLAVTLERGDIELEGAEIRDLATRIAVNARKLDRLVTDLLDLDRLSRGIVEPNIHPTELAALVRRVVSESDMLRDRRVHVVADTLIASVDGAKVERILENLLANTARHTPPGTSVWVRAEPLDDGVLLAVEDEGPGVAPEHRDDIFEPFRQGPGGPVHSPGVGVGLTLVARFAELHGGRAWVEEREGGGASFRVFLPDAGDGKGGEGAAPVETAG